MSDPKNLYEILGVTSEATSVEIRKAYRKLALAHHPDKVAEELREESEIRFKEISHAYEVLVDEEKRANYDTYGTEDGRPNFNGDAGGFYSNGGNGAEFGSEDFFNFFNGAHEPPRNHQGEANKTPDAVIEVQITLEDLYKGKVIKTTSTRNIVCKSCKGSGAKSTARPSPCLICEGKGYKTKLRRLAPGLVTQENVVCTNCDGLGKIYKKKDKCKRCDGKKLREETKILEFNIEKGSKPEGYVVLKGESDEQPGKITGDVALHYTTKEHENFQTQGDDLYFKLNIKLFEALCGFTKKNFIKTLDNRYLSLSIPPGKVLRPGDYIKVPNEGMPVVKLKRSWFAGSDQRGDLYIELDIEFPKDKWFLEKNELNTVKSILSNVKYPTDVHSNGHKQNEQELESFDIEKFSVVSKSSLPEYEKETPYEEPPKKESYYDGYYDSAGVEPECQQQ